jgi:hypothetical protein
VEAIVAVLSGRSLTVLANETDRVVVHRLVQRVVRESCQQTDTLDTTISAAVAAIGAVAARANHRWLDRALLTEYTAHVQALLSHATNHAVRKRASKLLRRLMHLLNGTRG